jgi:predicted hydrocarbon binding protein
MSPATPTFRERLAFDESAGEIRDQTRRYMLIRPEALMGVFRRLPPTARMAALDAFTESIVEQGSDSARAYRAMGDQDAATLLDTIAATAPQLGWGRWRFNADSDLIRLEVRNSPFAAGFGPAEHPVCHAIVGMLRAVGGIALGRPVIARETACAAMGADICRFEARPESTP